MNSLVNFIFESGVSLALLSLIYLVFLRKETFFRLNRIFLLISVTFSIVLPFLKFQVYEPKLNLIAEVTVTPYRNLLEAVTIYGQDLSGTVVQSIISSRLIIFIYLGGLLLFMGRFILRLIQISILIYGNRVEQVGTVKFVSVNKDFSPFSFLSFIFINPEKRQAPGYEKIVAHELEHIKQGHTFDVLILEIMTVVQWFNPFMWMLKRVIRENHEFLADQAVLNSGISAVQYKQLLLSQALGFQIDLANGFGSSLVKNRIKMISKIRSSQVANLKYVIGILTVLALVVIFACEQKDLVQLDSSSNTFLDGTEINTELTMENQASILSDSLINAESEVGTILDETETIFMIVEAMPEFPGGDLALRKFISNSVIYPEESIENGIQGKVYVSFVVTKNGDIANTTIARGVDPYVDKEALRVVNSLPKWKPGYQKGNAVNVSYTVPINFVLN
jgi:TonB family protein